MILRNPLILVAAACLGWSGCADPPKKPESAKPASTTAPKLVGRIASIPAERRFVLIQSYGKWTVESGTILTTRGPDERSANLRTTGETLGEFAAADLQAGTVEVGDAVYSQHVPKPAEEAPPATPLPAVPELPTKKNN
jgi:hypothetical protein